LAVGAGEGEELAAPDLGQQAGGVEIDTLVGDPVILEEEHRDNRHMKRLAGRSKTVKLTEVRSEQVELRNDGVVGDMEADVVMPLVGKRRPSGAVLAHDLDLTVECLAGRHDLVVRVGTEGRQRPIELLCHLGSEVLLDDLEAALPQFVGHCPTRRARRDARAS
jgi:hypothetical protein